MSGKIISLADRQSQAVRDRAAKAVNDHRATINGRLTLGHLLGEGPGLRGTIHVMSDGAGAFVVSHESASGSSWGGNHGPFATVEAAASAATALNINSYDGGCDIVVHDMQRADQEGQ